MLTADNLLLAAAFFLAVAAIVTVESVPPGYRPGGEPRGRHVRPVEVPRVPHPAPLHHHAAPREAPTALPALPAARTSS